MKLGYVAALVSRFAYVIESFVPTFQESIVIAPSAVKLDSYAVCDVTRDHLYTS